jgi:single-strand DNA-binding protein
MADTTATIVGNLTGDPELRYTPSGAAVANFTVAVTPRRPDGKGGWEDGDTSFLRCTAWRGLAEHVAELTKGDRMIVYGRLQQRSWETDAGERRSVVEVQAEDVGPSLRWATAKPERTSAKAAAAAGAGKGGGQFNDEPPF